MRYQAVRCRIPDLLAERGWTQSKLEELSGIPDATLSRYSKGRSRDMPLGIALAISDALNVVPRDLFEWE